MRKAILFFTLLIYFTSVIGQEISVSGQVKNEQGEPVPYAAITVKKSNRSVVADVTGRYTIKASNGDILVVSSVGLKSTEVTVSGATTDVTLERSIVDLGNVLVGSRSLRRTATETVAPVDIIPVSKVMNQLGQVDINQILQL